MLRFIIKCNPKKLSLCGIEHVKLSSFTPTTTSAAINMGIRSTANVAAPSVDRPAELPRDTVSLKPLQSAASELSALASSHNSTAKASVKVDRFIQRHIAVAMRLVEVAVQVNKASGLPSDWVKPLREEQLRRWSPPKSPSLQAEKEAQSEKAVFSDCEASKAEYSEKDSSSNKSPQLMLVNLLNTYIRYECELEALLSASPATLRLRGKKWLMEAMPYRLDSLERQYILHLISNIMEKREVSLVVASRLLRRRWPNSIADSAGAAHQRFVVRSIFAWIAEIMQKDVLTPQEARAILNNGAFALKSSGTILVGKLAIIAIRDIESLESAEALISVMWSVSSSGVHAPDVFWRKVFLRLTELNRAQKGLSVSTPTSAVHDAATKAGDENGLEKASGPRHPSRRQGAHVFSGLTTRQLYRILAVLKKERWSGEAGEMHELADQALKNIVFEAEALVLFDKDLAINIPKKLVVERLRSISDLSFHEFLELLTIAGDLGVPFHISALRISDIIFVPLTQYLDHHQLLSLLVVVRQTRCYSTSLMSVIAKQIQRRGPFAPYALPLSKAFLRAAVREKTLLGQPSVEAFVEFFFGVCAEACGKIRIMQLAFLGDLVYSLYRSYSPDSFLGLKCKEIIDLFCHQADRLLQLQLASTEAASKLLELTMVMGMRDNPQRYTNVAALLQTRIAASTVEETYLKSDVEFLAAERENGGELLQLPLNEAESKPQDEPPMAVSSPISLWSQMKESELPTIPKAAMNVYHELLYLFEKMVVVRSEVTAKDKERFDVVIGQAGLYNLFLGAHLMQQGHLTTLQHASVRPNSKLPNAFPLPIQRRVHKILMKKLGGFRTVSTKNFSDQDLLHILGQVHCPAEKLDRLLHMIQTSPLVLLKQQREVWLVVEYLASRFGNESQLQKVRRIIQSSSI